MRAKLFILFTILFTAITMGCEYSDSKRDKPFEVIVIISPNDCINCSALLNILKENKIDFQFIVENDKETQILRKALRSGYADHEIVIKPKMYRELNQSNRSSITLMKKDEIILQKDLKGIHEIIDLAIAMNRGFHRVKSFKIPEGISTSGQIQICASESYLNILDQFTNTIYQCSKSDGSLVLENTIDLDDVSILDLYVAKTNDTSGFYHFNRTRKYFAQNNPSMLQIKYLNTSKGTSYASIEMRYPRQKSKNEITLEPSVFIAEISSRGLIEIEFIPRPFKDVNYPRVDEAFYVDSQRIYTYFNDDLLPEYSHKECHKFLVSYTIDDRRKASLHDHCLPSYWHDYGLSSLARFNFDENIGYFQHFPWFVIKKGNSFDKLVIEELSVDYSSLSKIPPEKGIIINSAYSRNEYLFVFYYNAEDSCYKELVYNIPEKKTVSLSNVFKYPDHSFTGQLQYNHSTGALWALNIEERLIYYFY